MQQGKTEQILRAADAAALACKRRTADRRDLFAEHHESAVARRFARAVANGDVE